MLGALALAVLVGVTVLVYAPGLNGVFVFDSVDRVVRNESLRIDAIATDELLGAAYAAQGSFPQRGLAYVSLALNYYFSGERFDPFAFKLTNLTIHILNGLLVFVLARLTIGRWRMSRKSGGDRESSTAALVLACVAAGVWLLHPIQLTSVLYVVQRMTSLAATWVLVGAIVYVVARARLEKERAHSFVVMYVGVIACTAVGFLFKQNAIVLPALVAVLELFLFDRQRLAPSARRGLKLFFVLALTVPVLVAIAAMVSGAAPTAGSYEHREFDMLQRLLSQARVLFFYASLLAFPVVGRFGLFHDDIAVSAGLLDPWTTLLAVAAWAALAILVVRGARKRAPWAFAIAWFLVGHALESSILPLELAHEHRNYAPSVGVAMVFAFYSGEIWRSAGRMRALVPAVLVVWLSVLALVTHVRADAWRDPAVLMATLARHHPDSYRSVSGYAFNSVPRDADLSVRFEAFQRAAALSAEVVSPLIEMTKLALALGYYLGGAERAPAARGDQGRSMRIGELELRADAGHNALLLAALDEEITRRLGDELPRTGNVVALISLVDCSVAGSRACADLRENAVRWHASALSNERLPSHLKAVLELSLAKLYAMAGDGDEAVNHAHQAGRLAGNSLTYRLQEATLYAMIERWEELGVALADIDARFPVRAPADSTYRDLRALYERSRAR